ncbi:hypothetical protein HID58_071364 [Brassica napus]|uniref:Uncharacterized protein n=1 Tax=Brassica napus TaxID=3708 RepID=A0ABQ7Z1E0_BRANA|nr:hypothetical protein HID58_071364 [Brassica napus]
MLIESASSLLLADRVTSGVELWWLVSRKDALCYEDDMESSPEIKFASFWSVASLRRLSERLHAVFQGLWRWSLEQFSVTQGRSDFF